jgi:hypothetical protein
MKGQAEYAVCVGVADLAIWLRCREGAVAFAARSDGEFPDSVKPVELARGILRRGEPAAQPPDRTAQLVPSGYAMSPSGATLA